jgi:signal transduction histidine kinase
MIRLVPLAESLRLRFFAAILLWVALGIGGIWYSATRVFAKHIEQEYHDDLYGHVRELATLVTVTAPAHLALTRPLSDPRFNEPLSGFYWQVSVHKGEVLRSGSMRRGGLDEDIAHTPDVVHRLDQGPTGPAITYGFTRLTPDGRIIHYVIATDQRYLDQAISGFTRELTLWLLALAAGLGAIGLAVIAFGLRPLTHLAEAITALRTGQATSLQGRFPQEIQPLVSDLNAYVAQNQAMVERGRVQAGNLAHSLRTPLAIITDEAEQLACHPLTTPSAQILLGQSEAMVQQIDYHLARARSAAGARIGGRSASLAQVLPPLLSAMARLHPGKTYNTPALPPELSLAIDPVDLAELLSILLDNAGKWARSTITLRLTQGPPSTILTIADDGPGLAPERISSAFDIGTRFDPAISGSGLGLAIARDIAQAYGATLDLLPGQGGGLQARLILPA